MNENGQNMNPGEYTYSGNQGQVFAPAPERHQQTTTIDGVNRFGRYVNNEYMQGAQNANVSSGLSSEIAAKAEAERLAMQAQNAQAAAPVTPAPAPEVQPAQSAAPAVPASAAPTAAPAAPAAPTAAPVAPAAPAPVAPAPEVQPVVQPQSAPQPSAPVFETSPVQAAQSVAQPQSVPQPSAPVFESSPIQAAQSAVQPQPQSAVQPAVSAAPAPAAPAPAPKKKEEKEKKKAPFGIRLLLMAASGLVFGLFAGGVILAMLHFLPNKLKLVSSNPGTVTSENPSVPTSEPVSELPSEGSGTVLANVPDGGIEGTVVVSEDMTVAEIAEACMPSVVIINSKIDYNYYGYVTEAVGSGTGVIVGQNDENLFIATNYHVVADAKEITVQFCDSSSATAEVKGKKVANDLAVITVKMSSLGTTTKDSIKLAQIGTSDDLVVGQSCVAIGNALGYGQSVTYGVISALNREMLTENGEKGVFIQTDAAINHGNSGGALLNMKGQLIGINSNKLDGSSVESMGYAIPIDTARPIIEKLIEKEELEELPAEQQVYFGISGYTVKSGSRTNDGIPIPVGIYVRSVAADSPADKGGIQPGDIITEIEGESVVSTTELMQYLASYPSGSQVNITYRRLEGGQFATHDTLVTLDQKKSTNNP